MENKRYWLFCALSPSYFCIGIFIYSLLAKSDDNRNIYFIISFLINFMYIKYFKLKKIDLLIPFLFLLSLIFTNYFFNYYIGYHTYTIYIITNLIILILAKNKLKYFIGVHIFLYFMILYIIISAVIFESLIVK